MDFTHAPEIKAKLIDHLLFHAPNGIFGNEVRFGKKHSRADLIFVSDKVHAFEIKSHTDKVQRFQVQYLEYKSVFDYVTLLVSSNHYKNISIPHDARYGLAVIDECGIIRIMRKPRLEKEKNKEEIAWSIPSKYIAEVTGLKRGDASVIRNLLAKNKSIKDIYAIFVRYLHDHLDAPNRQFNDNRGIVTHSEDLRMLCLGNKQNITP